MKNAMQLKAALNKFAKEKKILPQHAMQNYMLERLLERISVSKYRDYLIIKGGFLIASLAGLGTRSTINVLAYNAATLMAEKLETVISRGDLNTHPRDYYDIYILEKLKSSEIDFKELKAALLETSRHRHTEKLLADYKTIMDSVIKSPEMQKYWAAYSRKNAYANGITFLDACNAVMRIMEQINIQI